MRMFGFGKAGVWAITGIVFAMSVFVTFCAWRHMSNMAEDKAQREFEYRVRDLSARVTRRMTFYEQALRSVKTYLRGSIHVGWNDFRSAVQTLEVERRFPGIQALGVSEWIPLAELPRHVALMRSDGFSGYIVFPEGQRDAYSAITHIEPFTPMNARAFGYDMYSEPVRRAAMMQARDTGAAVLSGKVTLIQEGQQPQQSGFLMYMAVYQQNKPVESLEQRREALVGWVYAPFRMNDFMANTEGERSSDLIIDVFDGHATSDTTHLFRSPIADARHVPRFHTMRQIAVAEHPWTLSISSSAMLEQRLQDRTPQFVALTGGTISLLLTLFVHTLARGRRRALHLATQMTSELSESEFRWKYALEGAGDGVWDWDIASGTAIYSRRWKAMLGYDDADIGNWSEDWKQLLHSEDRLRVLETIDNYLQGRTPVYATEMRMLCKDGSYKWIFARGTAVSCDAEGRPLRIIGTHTDITERKQTAQRDAERQQALEEARAALEHSQKLEAIGKLTGGVAHDFNNVLQVISANLQLLSRDKNRSLKERVNAALQAVDRGAKLTSHLLAFARRQPLQPLVCNLGRLVRDMDEVLCRTLGGNIEIRTSVERDAGNTLIDPHQFENVVLNLAINARDAMPHGGVLTLHVENTALEEPFAGTLSHVPAGQYVRLSVTDTGIGMSEEVMARAIEPFFTTKPEGQGTGLGLSMAYGFVKQSGGHMRIESGAGTGTRITIYLPRTTAAENTLVANVVDEPVNGGNETILVVEDNPDVLVSVVDMLAGLGYRVLQAHDGQSAIAIIRGGVFIDVLFSDVVMPGPVRSTDMAQQAKQFLPELTVIYTSGYTRDAILQDGHLQSGVQLLSKPYRRDQLARKIRQALKPRRPEKFSPPSLLPASKSTVRQSVPAFGPESTRLQVLLVEDDEDMRQIGGELLAILGHEPTTVSSAEQALDMMKTGDYDVLITDISLPGMDGTQLVHQLAMAGATVPKVIFATGYDDAMLRAHGNTCLVLKKPYTLLELRQAIETVAR